MAILFRWSLRLALAMIGLLIAGVFLIYYLASQSLPEYEKTVGLPGVIEPTEIIRDTFNVPHIVAARDEDVFFGLGYAHAQDRLWQIMLMRRTAQGRLSEIFGAETLQTDKLLRRLDLYSLAQTSVAAQSSDARRALKAYAEGVNARIYEINRDALGRGAPEMFIFPTDVSPWRPADSLAILKLMSVQLSGHLANEVLRAKTSLKLNNADRLSDIMPDAPGQVIADLEQYSAVIPALGGTALTAQSQTWDDLSPFPSVKMAGASNVFAAAPFRAAAGGTLLANDPHLGLTAPTIWYLAHLELSSGGVIGATIPGIPIVLSGRSAMLGWGLTSSYLDDQDLLIEELDPERPEYYRAPEGYKKFLSRETIINIKDHPPVTITLRWSDNGPILPGTHYGIAEITPKGHVAALSWTALGGADPSFTAGFNLMGAQNVSQALALLKNYQSPSENIILADSDQIVMKTIGLMPLRAASHQTQGRMPSLGWRTENRWQGQIEYARNPEFTNPAGGILGNTNNKVSSGEFPEHLSFDWGDSQRIQRWKRLMQGRKVHTRESFIEAQLDTVSFTARALLPLIGSDLWFTSQAAPQGTLARNRKTALDLLAEWNGEMNEHMPEPLIFSAWMRALQNRLIRDELGPLADKFAHMEPLFIERVFRNINGAAQWCDVIQSAKQETCDEISRLALDDALVWLAEKYGSNMEAVRWGEAHQALHRHATLGRVPLLSYFVNIYQPTSGGDNTLLRGKTSGAEPEPFFNVHAAGYRGVYDFADPDSSVFVTATGQSGHFLSRHYDDLGQLWRRGEYIPMSLDIDLARAAAVGVTQITLE
ncbi:MAG: penicillin acylase family protein [Paracoccaceae bacterium]|nr:penicillin acylase family protein [Paracoccaceae bacterium]